MPEVKLVPPDGGYGWVIVCACALHLFIAIPIAQGFGLIFKDKFKDLNFSTADISLIMNTNAAFSMFVGIITAPLLKQLGYRKTAFCAACFLSIGVLFTAHANSLIQYVITYGFITALGSGMGMPSYSLALNSYFLKKRTKAAGYTMTICGFGPILMPQIISLLLSIYGVSGAMSVMGAIAGHSFISSFLLQPIKWHMKEEIVDDNVDEIDEDKLKEKENEEHEQFFNFNNKNKKLRKSTLSLEEEVQIETTYNIDTPLAASMPSLHHEPTPKSILLSKNKRLENSRLLEEDIEMEDLSSLTRADKSKQANQLNIGNNSKNDNNLQNDAKNSDLVEKEKENICLLSKIGRHMVDLFDLTLLKDPIFVNVMVGMSFAIFAELNFSILTPFIMQDFGLTTQQTATFMSTLSVADICFRFIAPYVGDFFKRPVRVMFMWSLVLLMASRFSLLLTSNYFQLLACAACLGVAKGFRTVYWTLVIPSTVPIERLAAASGLQSAFNSFFIWIGGPFLGFVRDLTGSFKKCIFVINFMTFLTIVMWTTEFAYKRYKSRKKPTRI